MQNPLEYFIGRRLSSFDFAGTLNGDDIALEFDGTIPGKRLILSHVFTIPFTIEDRLKRFSNWLKPLEHWSGSFVGCKLLKVDPQSYEKDFYLEFEGQKALLTNKYLVSILDSQNRCLWTTMEKKDDAKE
jgi:hypothetical protein